MSYFEFLEQIAQPAIVISMDHRILYANQYAKDRFMSIGNIRLLEGSGFLESFANSDLAFHGSFILKTIEDIDSKEIHQHNLRIHINSNLSMQVCLQKNNHPDFGIYWILTGVNITKQSREEYKLQIRYKEQLEVFKILFNMAPVGLGIKDFEGGFYKVNHGLSDITGYSKEELLTIKAQDLFPDYNASREQDLIRNLIESTTRSFRQEKILITAGGQRKVVSETINIVREDSGNPFLIIVSYLDITDEKELQKMLIESRKMEELGKLSGGIAHDFNNMLLPVTLCSDIALQEFSDLDLTNFPNLIRIKSYLEKISVSAQKAKTLVQKLFQYSQTGKYELIPIYMEKEIQRALDLLHLQKPPHIQIEYKKEEGEFPIMGEPIWIEQIIDNLVVNSFHSMKFKTTGLVTIRLFKEFGDSIVEVEDEGTGIEDEELQKIFQPFFTKKKSNEGTGMGLTIVQAMVHKMNGKVRVYSKPGIGTVFQVLIPIWNTPENHNKMIDLKVSDR